MTSKKHLLHFDGGGGIILDRSEMAKPLIETEETLIIETPERVPLAFSLASIGNRFLAVIIDHSIQYTAIAVVFWGIFEILASSSPYGRGGVSDLATEAPGWAIAILIIFVFLLFSGYFVFFEWFWNGQTPGKRLLKLRVIREDGRPITFWEAAARNLLRIFDAMPGFVVPIYSAGLIAIFANSRDQRIGDMFAGTVVIRERSDDAPTFNETFSNRIADTAFLRVQPVTKFAADISSVTLAELDVVESLLRRRWDLTERQRQWMAWRVALPIMFKLKPAYDLETFTYEGFLEELLHRYHARQRFLN